MIQLSHSSSLFPYTTLFRSWPSAIVAALFALHPLHVESVAWISERKDVLSGLFWNWCRSEEHTSELQSRRDLVCRLLLEKKKDRFHIQNLIMIETFISIDH